MQTCVELTARAVLMTVRMVLTVTLTVLVGLLVGPTLLTLAGHAARDHAPELADRWSHVVGPADPARTGELTRTLVDLPGRVATLNAQLSRLADEPLPGQSR